MIAPDLFEWRGAIIENGTIRLEKTLGELELSDVGGLLAPEREATIEHLITALKPA